MVSILTLGGLAVGYKDSPLSQHFIVPFSYGLI